MAKVSGALASNTCNSKPLKLITTWTSLFPLLIPKRTPLADYKSISASISSVFVAGSGNALRSPSIRTFRQATRSPRSLFNCGAGFCRSWGREKGPYGLDLFTQIKSVIINFT